MSDTQVSSRPEMQTRSPAGDVSRKGRVGDKLESVDPRDGSSLGFLDVNDESAVQRAVTLAREAARLWGATAIKDRVDLLLAARDVLIDRSDEMVATLCSETGKLEHDALFAEFTATCELMTFYAGKAPEILAPKRVSTGVFANKFAEIRREPKGVVGVISPWNYPLVLTMTPVVSALIAGNTAVLKPSEVTPKVGLLVGEIFEEAARRCGAPANIVQVLTGGGATGGALVASKIDLICFTGSVRTGKLVMEAASKNLTPVILELGGKDPMIVCEDADLERASSGAVWGAFFNSGQTCVSVERVYVAEKVYDEFVDLVVKKASAMRVGVEDSLDMGSMTFPPQLDIVERHVNDAIDKGAKALVGGRRLDRPGLWFEPTVMVDVDHNMELMTEETFGPVLPIMKFSTEDEAIALANDTRFGLNSSVWTKDNSRGAELASRIRAGNVCINDCIVNYGVASLPFGGIGESGIGRVHGAEGLLSFTNTKSVLGERFKMPKVLWWYPTTPKLTKILKRALKLRYRRGIKNKL